MLKVFLIAYTASGQIGAVSKSLPSMDDCKNVAQVRSANWGKSFSFKCEQHAKRPNITTKIDPEDRRLLESDCFNLGMPAKCEVLPNGDLRIMTSLRKYQIIKAKDLRK